MKISALSVLTIVCSVLLSLPEVAYAKKTISHQVAIVNKTQWPLLIWPIPEKAPPYLMARVPQQKPGMVTPPAQLGWPGNAQAMIIVAEPQMSAFEDALQKSVQEFNRVGKPKDFSWETAILQFRGSKGFSGQEWAVFYPTDRRVDIEDFDKNRHILLNNQDYDLVIYDKPIMRGTSNPTKK